MKDNTRRQLIIWLATGAMLIFIMVLIGGITRLTGSGLSMVKWELIMGAIPPLNEAAWNQAFEEYKQFPEFQVQAPGFGLSEFKSIFFWEYLHRFLGRLLGLVFALPFVYFIWKKKIDKPLLYRLLVLFFLGGFQGFLGWYMVKSGLVDKPHVSHFRLALHLITAFLTFGYTWWLILSLLLPKRMQQIHKSEKRFTQLFIGLILLQIIYGAFVAGLKAGYFYNTFPKMGDRWIAEGVYALEPFYMNFIESIAGVQFVHRYLAILIFVLALVFYFRTIRSNVNLPLKRMVGLVFLIVLLQETLGIVTLLYAVPLSMGVLHQIGAFLLLMTLIYTLRLCSYGPNPISSEGMQ